MGCQQNQARDRGQKVNTDDGIFGHVLPRNPGLLPLSTHPLSGQWKHIPSFFLLLQIRVIPDMHLSLPRLLCCPNKECLSRGPQALRCGSSVTDATGLVVGLQGRKPVTGLCRVPFLHVLLGRNTLRTPLKPIVECYTATRAILQGR